MAADQGRYLRTAARTVPAWIRSNSMPEGGNLTMSPPIRGHKLALAFDGGDAVAMLARMTGGTVPFARRALGAGKLAVSNASAPLGAESLTLYLGQPLAAGPLPAPVTADQARSAFAELDGAFVALHWDAAAQVLTVASDFLGAMPLYWRRRSHGIALFTETKAVEARPDPAGWGAFIGIGHPIGDRTLLEGVERFPPATVLHYDVRRNSVALHRYWRWGDKPLSWRVQDFVECLAENVRAYSRQVDRHTVLLSGGLDSRLILFLLQRLGISTRALIVTHDDELANADGRCAVAAAKAAAVPYEVCVPDADYFDGPGFLRYLAAVDGEFPTLGLFISKLLPYVPDGGIWDGLVPGAVFMNLHNPGGGFARYRGSEIAGARANQWQAAEGLFGVGRAQFMREAFEAEFAACTKAYPDDAGGVARFVLENRTRRRAAQNPLKAYANRATPFLPGMRRDLVEQALAVPHSAKAGGSFYRRLLREIHPRALDAPLFSGGQPVPRHGVDAAAIALRLRARLGLAAARHPRLFRPMGRRTQSAALRIPEVARAYGMTDTDGWIDHQALARLDPQSREGFQIWRLYVHWAAWRTIHGSGGRALPFDTK
ncbi:MAG TPA: hypothetical protein VFA95_08730 [Gammaproteobacteria bacterium]|nr:hypothetical protein [Gammaproteobacteria bacterium]